MVNKDRRVKLERTAGYGFKRVVGRKSRDAKWCYGFSAKSVDDSDFWWCQWMMTNLFALGTLGFSCRGA